MSIANKKKIIIASIAVLLVLLLVLTLINVIHTEEAEPVQAAGVALAVSDNKDGVIPKIDGVKPQKDENTDTGEVRYHFTEDQVKSDKVKNAIPALTGKKVTPITDDGVLMQKLYNNDSSECLVLLSDVTINWGKETTKSSGAELKANFFGNGYKVSIKGTGGNGNFNKNLSVKTNAPELATADVPASGVGIIHTTGLFVAKINTGVIVSTTTFDYSSSMSTLDYIDKKPTMLVHGVKDGMATAGIITGLNYGTIGNCVLNINNPFTFVSDGLSSGLGWQEIKENCAITGGVAGILANGGRITRTTINMAERGEINSLARGKENNIERGRSACSMGGAFVGNFVPTNHASMFQCTLNGNGMVQSLVGYATNQGSYQAYAGAIMGGSCYFKDDGDYIYAVQDYDIGKYGSFISGMMISFTGKIKHNYNIVFDKNYANVVTDYGKLFGKMGSANGLSKMIILYDFKEFCRSQGVSPNRLTTVGKGEFQTTDITIEEIGTVIYPTNGKGVVQVRHIYDVPNRDIEIEAIADGNSISDEDYKGMGNAVKKKFPVNHGKGNNKLGGIIWEADLKGTKEINPFSVVDGTNDYVGGYIFRFEDLAKAVGEYRITFGEVVDYKYSNNFTRDYTGTTLALPTFTLNSILNKSYKVNGTSVSNLTYSWFINNELSKNLDNTIKPGTYKFDIRARAQIAGSQYKDVAYYDEANNVLAYPNSTFQLSTIKEVEMEVKDKDNQNIVPGIWKKEFNAKINSKMGDQIYDKLVVIKNGKELVFKPDDENAFSKANPIYVDIKSSLNAINGDSFQFIAKRTINGEEVIVGRTKELENICIDHSAPKVRLAEFAEIIGPGTEERIDNIQDIEYTRNHIRAKFQVYDELSGIAYSNLTENVEYTVVGEGKDKYFAVNIELTGDNGSFSFIDTTGNMLNFNINVNIDNVAPKIEVNGLLGVNILEEQVFTQPYVFNANLEVGGSGYDLYMTTYFNEDTSYQNATSVETIKALPENSWTLFAENVVNGNNELTIAEEVKEKEIWFKLVNKQLDRNNQPLYEPVYVALKHVNNLVEMPVFTIDLRFGEIYINLANIFIKNTNVSLKAASEEQIKEIFSVEYNNNKEVNLSDKLEIKIKEYKNNTFDSYIGSGSMYLNPAAKFYDVNTAEGYQVWASYDTATASKKGKQDKNVELYIKYNPEKVSTLNGQDSTQEQDVFDDIDYEMRFPIHIIKDDPATDAYMKELRMPQPFVPIIAGTLEGKPEAQYLVEGNRIALGQVGTVTQASRKITELNDLFVGKEFIYGDEFEQSISIELSDGTPMHFNIEVKLNGQVIEPSEKVLNANVYSVTLNQLETNENYNITWDTLDVEIKKKEVYATPVFIPDGDTSRQTEDVPMSIQYSGMDQLFNAYIVDINLEKRPIKVTYTLNDVEVNAINNVGKYTVNYILNYEDKNNEDLVNYELAFESYVLKVTTAILSMKQATVETEYTGSVIPYQYDIENLDPALEDRIIKSGKISTQYYKYNDTAQYDPIKKQMKPGSTYQGTPITQVSDVGYYRVEIIFKGFEDNFIAQNYYDLLVINKAESIVNALDITVAYDGNLHGFDLNNTYANIMGKNTNVKIAGMNKDKFPIGSSYDYPTWLPEDGFDELSGLLKVQYKDQLNNQYYDYDSNLDEGKYKELGDYTYRLSYAPNKNYLPSSIDVKLHIVKAYMEGITIKGNTLEYDGKEHGITIEGLPEGATIEYLLYKNGNVDKKSSTPITQSNAGKYVMGAVVKKANYNDYLLEQVILEIKERDLNGIKIAGGSTTYDGKVHGLAITGLTKEEGKQVYFYNDPLKNNAKVIATVTDPSSALVGFVNANTYKGIISIKVPNYKKTDLPYTLVISPAPAKVSYDSINTQLEGQDYTKFDFSSLKASYETNGEFVECDVYIMKVEGEEEVVAQLNEDGTLAPGTYRIYANADQNYVVRDYAIVEIADTAAEAEGGMNQKTIIIIAAAGGGGVVLIGIIVGIVIAIKKKKSASF